MSEPIANIAECHTCHYHTFRMHTHPVCKKCGGLMKILAIEDTTGQRDNYE